MLYQFDRYARRAIWNAQPQGRLSRSALTVLAIVALTFPAMRVDAVESRKPVDEFPNYAQNAYCESLSPLYEENTRPTHLSQCRSFETSSRQRLLTVWSSIPPTAKASCQDQMTGLSYGSYFLLSICVVREVAKQLRSTLALAANDFPSFKPDLYCGASVETMTGESRAFILNSCLENERTSRTKLDRVWNDVPQDIKTVCGKQMDAFKDGSYFLLSICVVSEVAKRWFDNGGAIN